ncbi:MAG TPA: hypothetical protein VFX28_22915, partial [Methylomirabilota bacterium]|nr:hypothetical protein [Methylomirabilota bacterium]
RATTASQAREWARLLAGVRRVGGPAILTLLASGIYLMATRWGQQAWIAAGVAGLVLMAVLGGVLTGRRSGAIMRALGEADGALSAGLAGRLRDPVLVISAWLRTALALGIVFVMSTKPGATGALAAMGVALVLGLAAGFSLSSRGRAREPAAAQPVAPAPS